MHSAPEVIYRTRDWESAAQEAAFEGLCFCMIKDGRFVNRQAMPDHIPHGSRFALSERMLLQISNLERVTR